MSFFRMAGFHLRQFASVPYFIQLMVFSTVASALVQYVGYVAWGGITPTQGWLRAGIIGMWTTTTSAVGIIGFERYKGTLVYLTMGAIRPQFTLTASVGAAATFGLVSFPVAWVAWSAVSGSLTFTRSLDVVTGTALVGGIVALYVGCLAISTVIAALFVLTPNAITYEGLLLVPVLVASGVLVTSHSPSGIWSTISTVIPISAPVRVLYTGLPSVIDALVWAVVTMMWLGAGYGLLGRALNRAYRDATLELV